MIIFKNMLIKTFFHNLQRKYKLSDFIKTQKGDNLDNNKSVLSDVIESLIGAIYLDSNIDECRKFIVNNMLKIVSETDHPIKHSKSLLQEFVWINIKQLPKYSKWLNKSGPDHMPIFTVSVEYQ